MTLQQKDYDPALSQGAANTVALPQTITDATSSAFAVGPNGATNPVFQLDCSVASAANGVVIQGQAAGTAPIMQVQSSGTDEGLDIKPKGAGNIRTYGHKGVMISGQGATKTLTAADSGSLILFDRAAGIVFTLPASVAGLYFEFFVTTTITSNAAKVITADVNSLIIGGMMGDDTDSSDANAYFPAVAASSFIAVLMDGITHGGLVGSHFRLTCLSTTRWMCEGVFCATGTIATPFSAT